MTAETSNARQQGQAVAWRVPVLQSPFGERLDHGVRDELVLVMHRGTHGWKAAGQGHARLARQIYVKDVEPLCAASYEVAVVGLSGGGWRTVWARSDDDVTHPAPQSTPVAWITPGGDVSRSFCWCLERCLPGQQPRPLYAVQQQGGGEINMDVTVRDGAWVGTYAEWCRRKRNAPPSAPVGAAEDMVLDAIERRESSAPVRVELAALRVQEWLHAEHDLLVPVQEIEAAMRTPCSCPASEQALAQQPAAVDGSGAQAAEIEALRAEAAEAAKVLRGALDARTDGEPLRVLANRASNALYWRTESAERAKARAERLAEALRNSADALERLAFAIRAPNAHTPQLVELAIAMRAAAQPGGSDNDRV